MKRPFLTTLWMMCIGAIPACTINVVNDDDSEQPQETATLEDSATGISDTATSTDTGSAAEDTGSGDTTGRDTATGSETATDRETGSAVDTGETTDTASATPMGTDSESDIDTATATGVVDTGTETSPDSEGMNDSATGGGEAPWGAPVRITADGQAALYPAIAAAGDFVYLAWSDDRAGNEEIYFKRSGDRGLTWQEDVRITDDADISQQPAITVDPNGRIHLAWRDYRGGRQSGWYVQSSDHGETWSEPVDITEYPDSYAYTHPQIAMAADDYALYLVWNDNRDQNDGAGWHNPYYRISLDGGLTWSDTARLTTERISGGTPDVAVDGIGGVHVVWNWNYYESEGPVYKGSIDYGVTWGDDVVLTSGGGGVAYPAVAANFRGVFAVYGIGEDIFFKRSLDVGATWDDEAKLNPSPIVSPGVAPHCIAARDLDLYVVWSDGREGETNWEIYYMTSPDEGTTWGDELRLTVSDGRSQTPVIAVDDAGTAHVAWRDDRNGPWEIFYTRAP